MALRGLETVFEVTPIGARFPKGFATVSKAEGTDRTVKFDVFFFASKEAAMQGFKPIFTKSFEIPFDPQSGNFVDHLNAKLAEFILDESADDNPDNRIKADFVNATVINIPDPVLPEAEPLRA